MIVAGEQDAVAKHLDLFAMSPNVMAGHSAIAPG
jgi:hypothetical protein